MTAQKTIYGQRQISSSSQFYNPLNPAPGCPGRPSGQVVTVSTINCNYHHHHPWYCQVCHHRFSSLSLSLCGFSQRSCVHTEYPINLWHAVAGKGGAVCLLCSDYCFVPRCVFMASKHLPPLATISSAPLKVSLLWSQRAQVSKWQDSS